MSYTVRMENGDIADDGVGGDVIVRGAEKAAQDLLEDILRPYDPTTGRGCRIWSRRGGANAQAVDPAFGGQFVKLSLEETTRAFMQAQRADPATENDEVIQQMKGCIVQRIGGDPTRVRFLLVVTVLGEDLNVARAIQLAHISGQ